MSALALSDTLDLIKGYDEQINTLWNIYVAVLGAVLTVVISDRWKPHPVFLASAFAVFAAGNLYALQKFFRVKFHLLQYAKDDPANGALIEVFKRLAPGPLMGLYGVHLLFDVTVITVIFLFAKTTGTGRSRAAKS